MILETSNRIRVTLHADSISAEFNNQTDKPNLNDVFVVGQPLAFKVIKSAKKKGKLLFF
jgi:hypothetical protein